MERSGIETLLEAAALDAAAFFQTPTGTNQQANFSGGISQDGLYPSERNGGNKLVSRKEDSRLYSPATSPEATTYASYHQQRGSYGNTDYYSFHQQQQWHEQQLQYQQQQPSPHSPPDQGIHLVAKDVKEALVPSVIGRNKMDPESLRLENIAENSIMSEITIDEEDGKLTIKDESKTEDSHGDDLVSDVSQEIWDHCASCTPETAPAGKLDWIECGKCQQWFHYTCVDLTSREARNIDEFHCPSCTRVHGPSTLLRKSKRKHAAIDYMRLDQGEGIITDQHPYCQLIRDRSFSKDQFKRIEGSALTRKFALNGGVLEPVVIPKDRSTGLDLSVPKDLTVRKVLELVGADMKLEVIDVPTQHESPSWDLKKWADYYDLPPEERDRVRNVISLEVSGTKLGDQIRRPKFVRDMDLTRQVWPQEMRERGEWPKVELYCLMSVKNAYTDFHIDFGGSSVFYHIVEGVKVFLFVPPTASNLSKYEHWCLSSDQSKIFFGDLVKDCYKVELLKGDTMIIPSGWIHAVYTPVDSLVIGGNFLTALNLSTEIQVSRIEQITKVPRKFRFPHFSKILWYTAIYYINNCSQNKDDYSEQEMDGMVDLANYIYEDAMIASGKNRSATSVEVKNAKSSLPVAMKDACKIAGVFGNWVSSTTGRPPFGWLSTVNTHLTDNSRIVNKVIRSSRKRKRSLSAPHEDLPEPSNLGLRNSIVSSVVISAPNALSSTSCNTIGSSEDSAEHGTDKTEVTIKKELDDISKFSKDLDNKEDETLDDPLISENANSAEPKNSSFIKSELEELPTISENKLSEYTDRRDDSVELDNLLDKSSDASKLAADSGLEESMAQGNVSKVVHDMTESAIIDDDENDAQNSDSELSETSTVIDEEMMDSITNEESSGKKFFIYEELVALHNSRTRSSMSNMKTTILNDANSVNNFIKKRRSSMPEDNEPEKQRDAIKKYRLRRKSTPGSKKSLTNASNALVNGSNRHDRCAENVKKFEYLSAYDRSGNINKARTRLRRDVLSDSATHNSTEDRDVNNQIHKSNPLSRSQSSKNSHNVTRSTSNASSARTSYASRTKDTPKMANDSELNLEDEAIQRLIREAQLGIRSRR
ncbi:hypothetical protein V1511DRAFT_243737 [Dipodascopsis uninucleata]